MLHRAYNIDAFACCLRRMLDSTLCAGRKRLQRFNDAPVRLYFRHACAYSVRRSHCILRAPPRRTC